MKKTGFVFNEKYLAHETGENHPENPNRLRAIIERLEESGLYDELVQVKAKPAGQRWIELVHHIRYIMRFQEACEMGMPDFDHPENVICRATYQAALAAAGGVITAIDKVMEGELDTAFCAVRPPGHHAEIDKAMGFCYFNTTM